MAIGSEDVVLLPLRCLPTKLKLACPLTRIFSQKAEPGNGSAWDNVDLEYSISEVLYDTDPFPSDHSIIADLNRRSGRRCRRHITYSVHALVLPVSTECRDYNASFHRCGTLSIRQI